MNRFMEIIKNIGAIIAVVAPIFIFCGWVSSIVVQSIEENIAQAALTTLNIQEDDVDTRKRTIERRIESIESMPFNENKQHQLEMLRAERDDYIRQLKNIDEAKKEWGG